VLLLPRQKAGAGKLFATAATGDNRLFRAYIADEVEGKYRRGFHELTIAQLLEVTP
jgi:hypothetical protein